MMRIGLAIVLFCSASAAAECRPEGRAVFADGLAALARRDLSTAAAQFTALVHSQPDCAEACNNLAVVEVEQGRLDEAAERLRRALQVRPDYERVRLNLQRVEALLAAQTQHAPQLATPEASVRQTAEATVTETATLAPAATVTPEPTATKESSPESSGVAAPESQVATDCVIDVALRRMCLYPRAAEAIASETCFPIARLRVESWPQWLITGDTGGQHIGLLDETGRRRLKVVPEPAAVAGDAVWLRQSDFNSLAAMIVPWRTTWIVVEKPVQPASSATVAAIQEALQRWRLLWEQKQFDEYVAAYSQSFVPQSEPNLGHWRARKRSLFERPGNISVQIAAPTISVVGDGTTVITVFEQSYCSPTTVARELKTLRWRREGEGWKITAETVLQQLQPGAGR